MNQVKNAKGKFLKLLGILLAVYVGIVVLFESLLGYFQPEGQSTLTITTIAPDGNSHDRVLALLESDDELYVAANHWPRAWYRHARANPRVQATIDGEQEDYRAVPVSDQERERLREEHGTGLFFKFLTGFPPRRFLRLDPVGGG